jgi:hypothetical protein
MPFLEELKKHCIGFPCINLIEDYTNASHRIFAMTEFGIVTLYWFKETNKLICKNKKFREKLKLTSLKDYLTL